MQSRMLLTFQHALMQDICLNFIICLTSTDPKIHFTVPMRKSKGCLRKIKALLSIVIDYTLQPHS